MVGRSRDVGVGRGLSQQVGEQLAEAIPEPGRQIVPPELSEAVEVQLGCSSSGHGVEPPRSNDE
jgi:hypothetical protein